MLHLIHSDGRRVKPGDPVTSFRGDAYVVTGWREPQHAGSTGRVYVRHADDDPDRYADGEFYPSVFDLRWTEEVAS